jgi:DNA-binding GntR family transcriptional regulator
MRERLSSATLNEWAQGTLTSQVAARLARELRSAARWFPVDPDREIARRLDVSSTTVSEAKRLLASHGEFYYVA